jgi:hypothetical protein
MFRERQHLEAVVVYLAPQYEFGHARTLTSVGDRDDLMAKKGTLWPITRATRAKHTILRKYLDAWLPILGAGRYAHEHLVLIDGFAGPGRYGEPGSPLIMLTAYADHSAALDGTGHFFFIEEHHERCEHLRSEVAKLSLPPKVHLEILEGSFVDEFPGLIDRLMAQFGQLPPTFAPATDPRSARADGARCRRIAGGLGLLP